MQLVHTTNARRAAWLGATVLGLAAGAACGEPRSSERDCVQGAIDCPCTQGGGCDPGLSCVGGTCVGGGATDGSASASGPGTSGTSQTTMPPTSGSSSATGGFKLDVGSADVPVGECNETGCKQIDLLFAIDSSASMIQEIDALRASQAFQAIVTALENVNCGGIEYRIGLTDDNDRGFIGSGTNVWFDSATMTPDEIVIAFDDAAGKLLPGPDAALGCEHVLSSATALLAGDTSGFLRADALLVLVLITDVDDYGYYDQFGWEGCGGGLCPCDLLCQTSGAPVDTILGNLVTLKGGDAAAISSIVLAGNPEVMEGSNLCQQPATCCGTGGLECAQALHAPRLYEFAELQGSNAVAVDICMGAQMVPVAVESALGAEIDLACQTYEPEG